MPDPQPTPEPVLDERGVEAAARALHDSYASHIQGMPEWDDLPEHHRNLFLKDARAAIEASGLLTALEMAERRNIGHTGQHNPVHTVLDESVVPDAN